MKTFLLKSRFLSSFFLIANLFLASAAFAQATVTTDKLDYSPGEIAIVTGSGWTGDQFVDLHFAEEPFVDDIHEYHDIPVNPDGTFRVEFPILMRHLGVTFTLTAEGKQTLRTAVHVFTDANVKFSTTGLPPNVNVTVQYQGTAQPSGNSVNSSITFSTGGGGNGASTTIALSGNLSFQFPYTISVSGTAYTLSSTNPVSPTSVTGSGNFPIEATYVSCVAPSISNPGPQSANTSPSLCTAFVNYTVTATGTPTPTLSYSFSGATTGSGSGTGNGSTFNKGVTNVIITASNGCGSNATSTFTVTVADNIKPTIVALPSDISVNNNAGVCGATVYWTAPTSADNCAGSTIAQTAGAASGTVFPIGVSTITYTATDAALNTYAASFTITVTDNEKPTIVALPGNISVNNNAGVCGATVSWTAPTSADNCAGSTIAQTAGAASGTVFPIGVSTITYTVTDAALNTYAASFTITVTDNEKPTIVALPGNISVNNNAGVCGATVSWTAPTSADNCAGSTIAQTASAASGTVFPIGVSTITYTATDAALNTYAASFTITVTDNEKPTIVALPGNISVNNNAGVCGATVSWTAPTSADNCAGSTIAQTAGAASGTVFPIGVSTITYTATDAALNTYAASFTITVTDNEKPTIVALPGNISVNNNAGVCGATVSWTAPTSADNCAGSTIAQTAGAASGTVFPIG
ncbi:HYR domain-containing protein, partial [Flavobacterium sp. RSP29]|uniref:HYR domain-containing protein n=1 Tax=Flavobacterium sp. RSP29 TaxID=3401731 RepID=UPI003AAA3E30